MKEKELEAVVDAVWRRIEERLGPRQGESRMADPVPDAETRFAIWKQATRPLRLAKNVDLRDFALRYPVTEHEIVAAAKAIHRPGAARAARQAECSALQLKESLIRVLGYSVLALRDVPREDDPPIECPEEKTYDKPGSWCHEKEEGKGDFICRGDEKKKKDFVCTPKEYGFFCQKPKGQEKFICDANGSDDSFECKENRFLCDANAPGPFYCQPKEKGSFTCKPTEPGHYVCDVKGGGWYGCSPKDKGAGFNDKCYKYECFPKPRGTFECPPPKGKYECEKKGKGAGFDECPAFKCSAKEKFECPEKEKYDCPSDEKGAGFDVCFAEKKFECILHPKGKFHCESKEKGAGFDVHE